jgi:hypothetical protein
VVESGLVAVAGPWQSLRHGPKEGTMSTTISKPILRVGYNGSFHRMLLVSHTYRVVRTRCGLWHHWLVLGMN